MIENPTVGLLVIYENGGSRWSGSLLAHIHYVDKDGNFSVKWVCNGIVSLVGNYRDIFSIAPSLMLANEVIDDP